MSVVATIGYIAFLAGPPLIGFLGEHTGTLRALTVTGGLVALGLFDLGRPAAAARFRARRRRTAATIRRKENETATTLAGR